MVASDGLVVDDVGVDVDGGGAPPIQFGRLIFSDEERERDLGLAEVFLGGGALVGRAGQHAPQEEFEIR